MEVWAFSVMRNEARLLPYWLRHYETFCTRLVIYDDQSDDGTRDIARAAGVEIFDCPWSGLDDAAAAGFATEQYRLARGFADWVIWVDGDEFLYHPEIVGRLSELRDQGVGLPWVHGYSMFANKLPSGTGQIYEEIDLGIFDSRYSKPVIVNPMVEMSWGPGRHEYACDGYRGVPDEPTDLKLLHYRWFGEEEYLERNARNLERISPGNMALGYGIEVTNPWYTGPHSYPWYVAQAEVAQKVV